VRETALIASATSTTSGPRADCERTTGVGKTGTEPWVDKFSAFSFRSILLPLQRCPVPTNSRKVRNMADLLREVMESDYFRLNLKVRSEKTRKQYRFAIANYAEFLTHDPLLSDLNDDNVTEFVGWLRDVRSLHPRTVNDRRGRINSLWRWLADRGVVKLRPTNCGLVVPTRTPDAWSQEDLRQLLRACYESPGSVGGVPLATFWVAFHGLAWDTGARTSELLALRWEWFDRSRPEWLRVPASARKGGRFDATYRLMPDTLAVLEPFRRPEGLILQWDSCESRFYQLYRELLIRAGLPSNRYCKPQRLRRSHASWLQSAGGDATASLGHQSPAVTRRAYLDPAVISPGAAISLPFRVLD